MLRSRLAVALLGISLLGGNGYCQTVMPARPEQFEIRGSDGEVHIAVDDVLVYEWASHTLTLKPMVRRALFKKLKGNLIKGEPFIVAVGAKSVYQGYWKSVGSSIGCATPVIVIDGQQLEPKLEENQVRIELGYPTQHFFRHYFKDQDPRGDERIRKAFEANGILKTGTPEPVLPTGSVASAPDTRRVAAVDRRLANLPDYGTMAKDADLVAIAAPISRVELEAPTTVPGVTRGTDPIPAVAINTTFSPVAILKGSLTEGEKDFVFRHLREKDPPVLQRSPPMLIDFVPNDGSQYLMFLRRRDDGRYEAVNGQVDPAWCIEKLQHKAWKQKTTSVSKRADRTRWVAGSRVRLSQEHRL